MTLLQPFAPLLAAPKSCFSFSFSSFLHGISDGVPRQTVGPGANRGLVGTKGLITLEAIATRLFALGWRPSLVGWRPLLFGWRP